MYANITARPACGGGFMPMAFASSGDRPMRMAMTNQIGTPTRTTARYFRRRSALEKSEKKSPRATSFAFAPSNIPDS
jgi:hypothetical protein